MAQQPRKRLSSRPEWRDLRLLFATLCKRVIFKWLVNRPELDSRLDACSMIVESCTKCSGATDDEHTRPLQLAQRYRQSRTLCRPA